MCHHTCEGVTHALVSPSSARGGLRDSAPSLALALAPLLPQQMARTLGACDRSLEEMGKGGGSMAAIRKVNIWR